MSKSKITLDLSKQRCNEILKATAEDFTHEKKAFTVSERDTITVLRTYVTMQKRANLLDCRISIHSEDGRTSLKPSYTPSVFLLVYIMIFSLIIFLSGAINSPVNAEAIFCIFMFIGVPAFFCIREMKSYNRFWEYFKKIVQQRRTDQVYETEQS